MYTVCKNMNGLISDGDVIIKLAGHASQTIVHLLQYASLHFVVPDDSICSFDSQGGLRHNGHLTGNSTCLEC